MRVRTICLLAVSLVVLILAGAAITYLRSARFQERAREMLIARIENATGLDADVGRFSLDILRGRFLLNRFELRSQKGTGSRFSLTVDEISGSIRLAVPSALAGLVGCGKYVVKFFETGLKRDCGTMLLGKGFSW